MSNAINSVLSAQVNTAAKATSPERPSPPNPDQLANGYAVKPPQVKQLDPLVPPPSLDDFEMRPPPLFPGMAGLPNPEVKPPAGVDKLRDVAPSKRGPEQRGESPGVSVSISRATAVMESVAAADLAGLSVGLSLDDPGEAATTASITRDQIRYEPKAAMAAQANSTSKNVLALLK